MRTKQRYAKLSSYSAGDSIIIVAPSAAQADRIWRANAARVGWGLSPMWASPILSMVDAVGMGQRYHFTIVEH